MPMDEDAWRRRIREHREEKDHVFAHHPQSPLPAEDRRGFEGLAYFDPDPAYRFEAALHEAKPERITIPRTTGDEVTYTRVGTFRLDLPGGRVELAAFKTPNGRGDQLFVPFKDATAPEVTYGAGRYLEAEQEGQGRWVLDFNLAYHPFCAYNDDYACALPPHENHVDVEIRAGERLPEGHAGGH